VTHRLVTIRYSHYCEKARWALERARVDFVEEPHVPVLSWLGTLGARGNRTAPVFVADGKVLPESTDVLKWTDEHGRAPALFPEGDAEVERLEDRFDRILGPTARRVAYDEVLRLPRAQLGELLGKDAPRWEQSVARSVPGLIGGMIKRGLRVVPKEVERSRVAVDVIFDEVAEILRDGRPYLTGDRFTAADLTFAALATPVVFPEHYARYAMPFESMSPAIREIVERHRATPAGRFALRMYEAHRAPA